MQDEPWVPVLAGTVGPKYLAIANALAIDLRAGRLRAGDRLPPQRELARLLDVDLTTVTRAFTEARRRGLIEAHVGRGSYVRDPGADPQDLPPLLDLRMNMPPQPAAARLEMRITQTVAAIMSTPSALAQLQYQDSTGIRSHRVTAARWLEHLLGPVSPDRVLIASGAQTALATILQLLLAPGDTLCAGAFTYPGLQAIAAQRGLRVVPLAMDGEGILPDAFAEACERDAPKLLYCIPTMDNPTAATMSAGRRRAIVELARKYDVQIVEDDAYGALPATILPPLATLAPDRCWYIATLSKCATPALRIAYVVTPDAAATGRLEGQVRAASMMASPLMSALAARWIEDGTLLKVTAAIREENTGRQQLAAAALGDVVFAAHPEGHHLWLQLPAHWSADAFAAAALFSGLSIVPAASFQTGRTVLQAVRVSLGVVPERAVLAKALQRLGQLLIRPANNHSVV